MPYLRFTRDRRGYEHTYLLHHRAPGDRPRVLYWYRTAPGVLVGRPALDEDAIRVIEEQHPDIEFDWAQILEIGSLSSPEVEAKVEPRRRRPRRESEPGTPPEPRRPVTARGEQAQASQAPEAGAEAGAPAAPPEVAPSRASAFDEDDVGDERSLPRGGLLEELVGVGIATRLRARHAELLARLHEAPGDAMTHEEWAVRLDAVDPDAWVTPDDVLHGVQHADRLFDQLRREILGD